MRKTMLAIFLMVSLLGGLAVAYADTPSGYTSMPLQIHPSLPDVIVSVVDTGERRLDEDRDLVLSVTVNAVDGSFSQTFSYFSMENPALDQAVGMAKLEDINFDGYQDLLLLTGAGARNVFYALCFWDVEQGAFRPVEQNSRYDRETKKFSGIAQLELCNPVLYPEHRLVVSSVADGYAYTTDVCYELEGRYSLDTRYVWDVYDAGEGMIGELLALYAPQYLLCWDEQYPESWYYGDDGLIASERRASAYAMMVDGALWNDTYMEVANVDWVNLRQQTSKQSPSLAKLDAGTEVLKLHDGIGDSNGWVRVWLWQPDHAEKGLTGYIWHSFLEDGSLED